MTATTNQAKPCEEVHSWVHADGTRGFEMACGDTYDNIAAAELAAVRAGHMCGSETEGRPAETQTRRWPDLQPGEQVSLTIDDALVGYMIRPGRVAFELPPLNEGEHPVFVDLPRNHPQVRVDRATPADGVPQAGELWTDQTGCTYLALASYLERPGGVWLAGADRAWSWREVHTGPDGPIRRLMTVEQIASYR